MRSVSAVALGANRINVLRLVLREAGMLLLAGLAIGTGAFDSRRPDRELTAVWRSAGGSDYDCTGDRAIGLGRAGGQFHSRAARFARLEPMAAFREE